MCKIKFDFNERLNIKMRFNFSPAPSKQRGVVLIVSLVALLLMTMIGVTAMRDTGFQERMSGNLRDRNLAFQAAEAALRSGEKALQNQTTSYFSDTLSNPANWDGANPNPNGTVSLGSQSEIASDPVFFINKAFVYDRNSAGESCQGFEPNCGFCFYPVTTRGVGGTTDAVVVIQSNFAIRGSFRCPE